MAIGLAALVIALKQAPERGWTSGLVIGLARRSASRAPRHSCGARLRAPAPIVDLRTFADRRFAVGCILSFVLGIGLFGSVYLMPVFLAFVRGHDALEIGTIMLVTGVAQLLMAPVAVALEQRANARLLTAAGFGLFAVGLGMSAFQTPETDFAGMFWPQVVRGLAIMFCLLPPTRLALGHLDAGARAGRQRPVQPDAQSRRRHRPGADRHGDLHAGAALRRSHRCAASGRRYRDGQLRRHSTRPVREPSGRGS